MSHFACQWQGLGRLFLLLLLAGSDEGGNVGEEQRAPEHEGGADPVVHREGVLEVHDGEDEAEELAQGDHQGDGEAGALRGQHEHRGDADVLGDHVPKEVEQHDGQLNVDERDGNWLTREENIPVVEDFFPLAKGLLLSILFSDLTAPVILLAICTWVLLMDQYQLLFPSVKDAPS